MMTNEQYLLGKLAEEAAELAQIAIKAQQFGLQEVFGGQEDPLSNEVRITQELNDVLTVVYMLNQECKADIYQSEEQQDSKFVKVSRWRDYARSLKLVE